MGRPLLGAVSHQQVQRPRLLICGQEGAGQSHLGPALLYALEGLPVHALGLPSLLSDASARSVFFMFVSTLATSPLPFTNTRQTVHADLSIVECAIRSRSVQQLNMCRHGFSAVHATYNGFKAT